MEVAQQSQEILREVELEAIEKASRGGDPAETQGPEEGTQNSSHRATTKMSQGASDQPTSLPSAMWWQPHRAQGHHPVPRFPRAIPQQPELRMEDHGP